VAAVAARPALALAVIVVLCVLLVVSVVGRRRAARKAAPADAEIESLVSEITAV
jgi:hypothetical protein